MMIFIYGYYANVNYTTLSIATTQTAHYVNALVTQVRMTEGFDTSKEWAIIGYIQDPIHYGVWEEGLTYGGNSATRFLLMDSSYYLIRNALGYNIPRASQDEIQTLSQTEEVQAMPYWPNYGSIRIINDTIVIKCLGLDWLGTK